ncbi:MAG: zinc ribbon domain-containing protein [Defluviitaleaceae bacterium]|nr:zinc ribbon domain-containing protein [Defluviitaleaceae bacterium]MCL2274362.1 zinc ribbon domain-containing protein [Defluviitaleaceae bacterium]
MDEFLCQSCGSYFPIEGNYGTNADGLKSEDYCKYCWVNGAFGKPHETMEEMINSSIPWRIKSETLPDGYPNAEIAKNEMMKFFPTLKRWK